MGGFCFRIFGYVEGNNSSLVKSVYKTIQKTFPTAYVFPTESRPSNVQNIMIVSSNQPL